jgi:hypothetical protein
LLRSLTAPLGTPTADERDVQVVEFPATLDKRLTINLPDGNDAGWRLLDAPAAPARTYRTGAIYSSADYDVVQRVDVGALKESIAVHASQGVRTWSWKLSWHGGDAPSLAEDGTVHYGDRVVLAKPFLQDARGRRVRDLAWKLDGDVLSVRFSDRGIATPYVLDPASSYPQRLYPSPSYVPGSGTVNGLFATPPGGLDLGDQVTDIDDPTPTEYMFWSNSTQNVFEASIDNGTHPIPKDNSLPITNGNGFGAYGWAQESLGGVTLPLGPYSAQARIRVNTASGANPVKLRLKARIW